MSDHIGDDTLITSLPDEITQNILKNLELKDLYFASYACSKWMKLAKTRPLWICPRIGLSTQDPRLVLNIMDYMGCMELVESLVLHGPMNKPVDELLIAIRFRSKNLRRLSLRGQTLRDLYSIEALVFGCCKLEELVLEDTREENYTIIQLYPTKDNVRSIPTLHILNCGWDLTFFVLETFLSVKNLQTLVVEVIPHYVDPVEMLVAKHYLSLKHLRLKGALTPEVYSSICACVRLESLTIHTTPVTLREENFPPQRPVPIDSGDPVVLSPSGWLDHKISFPYLKVLVLVELSTLVDEVLETIADYCSLLQECVVQQCFSITIKSIQRILLQCTNLTLLEICKETILDHSELVRFMTDNDIPFIISSFRTNPTYHSYIIRRGPLIP